MRGRRFLVVLLSGVFVALAVAVATASTGAAALPRSAVGVNADGPMLDEGVDIGRQFSTMYADGVGEVRVPFLWAAAQPYPNWSEVSTAQAPEFTNGPDDVPTNFTFTDEVVEQAAEHHLTLMPDMLVPPGWDAEQTGYHSQPVHDQPFANYLKALVERYGPHGTLWKDHPGIPYRPVTRWQIWNEPNLADNWNTQPFAPSYVKLLHLSYTTIKRLDPTAQVVLAGLTNYSWRSLANIYKVRGARKWFDVAAFNAYTSTAKGVVEILERDRAVMRKYGDRKKPLLGSEFGWPASIGHSRTHYGFNTTEKGQARDIANLVRLLAADRRKLGMLDFNIYTWASTDPRHGSPNPWLYAGLLAYNSSRKTFAAKPAYGAFKRTVLALER